MKREVAFVAVILLPFIAWALWAGAEWFGVNGNTAVAVFAILVCLCLAISSSFLDLGLIDLFLPGKKNRDDDRQKS